MPPRLAVLTGPEVDSVSLSAFFELVNVLQAFFSKRSRENEGSCSESSHEKGPVWLFQWITVDMHSSDETKVGSEQSLSSNISAPFNQFTGRLKQYSV